jgi:hypothetical protein
MGQQVLRIYFRTAKRLKKTFTREVKEAILEETAAYKITLRREISKTTSQLLLCHQFCKGKRKAEVRQLIAFYNSLLTELEFDTS